MSLEFSGPGLLSALQHSRTWRHSKIFKHPNGLVLTCLPEGPQYHISSKQLLVLWTSSPFPQCRFSFIAQMLVLSYSFKITNCINNCSPGSCNVTSWQGHPFRSQELLHCLSNPTLKLAQKHFNNYVHICLYACAYKHRARRCRRSRMNKTLFLDL